MSPPRLVWGAGEETGSDWLAADFEDGPGIDMACDIVVDGLPLESDSVGCAYGRHALQRLKIWDLWSALREFYRVLRPGAAMRLSFADLDLAFASYREGRAENFWSSGWETLSGKLISQIVENGYLSTPLNFELAEEMLLNAGFDEVRRSQYRETTSGSRELVDLDTRPGDSFYVDAFKRLPSRPAYPAAPGPAGQAHLSWTADPSASLTVTWHTPAGLGTGFVEFRPVGHDKWGRVPACTRSSPGSGFIRWATLPDLLPSTEYEYRVSADAGAATAVSGAFIARTAPRGDRAHFRFAFLCDTGLIGRADGLATGTAQVLEELEAEDPLFVLGGGDYAYSDTDRRFRSVGDAVDAWFAQMQPLLGRRPLMAQYGNHDVLLNERLRDWAPRLSHPKGTADGKCYSFDVGAAHFAAFFAPGPALKIEHLVWLDEDLALAKERSARWLIVFQHEPIYAHGRSHPARPPVRDALVPVLQRHGVDLHLSGHDQNYERTYPLTGPPAKPALASTNLDRYEAGCGVIYAKVSPAGKRSDIRKDFSRFTDQQHDFVAVRNDGSHHYAVVAVRGERELEVSVFGIDGCGSRKTRVDSFRIITKVEGRAADAAAR